MNDDEQHYYPDFPPDTMGDTEVTKLERLPGMRDRPPTITWGEKFKSWPLEKQVKFACELAESMNHAADVSQQHMRRMSDACFKMEAQLKQAQFDLAQQKAVLVREMAQVDTEKQQLYQELGGVQKELKITKRQAAVLQAKLEELASAGSE